MAKNYQHKVCPVCGQTFTPANGQVKYCSDACREIRHRESARLSVSRRREAQKPQQELPRKLDRTDGRKAPTYGERICIVCGHPFIPTAAPSRCCSEICSALKYFVQHSCHQRAYLKSYYETESPEHRSERLARLSARNRAYYQAHKKENGDYHDDNDD